MTFSIRDVRLDGCLFEPTTRSQYRTEFVAGPIPDHVDLRPHCTAVENQGAIGSCTANAAVGALEYHFNRRDGDSPELSRMFVYFNTRRLKGDVLTDSGATISEAMAAVLAYGACREELWPYGPELFAAQPPEAAYEDARGHAAIQYARVQGERGAIRAVAEGLPVVFGTFIPAHCYEEAAQTGVIPPLTDSERRGVPPSGHAMLIVGYDNRERQFLVRNSWGQEWGDGGYCRIPFDVMRACSPADAFWVIGELQRPGRFTLVSSSTVPAAQPELPAMKSGTKAGAAARLREEIRADLQARIGASADKVDRLLAGRTARAGQSSPASQSEGFKRLCTYCMGSGICWYCQGIGRECLACRQTGLCQVCDAM